MSEEQNGETLPDRRKHGYKELEERMDTRFAVINFRQRRFFIGALIVFAIIGVAVAVSLLGFSIVLRNQADLTDRIQQQRYDSLVQSCTDTNDNNRVVKSKIDEVVANVPDVPPGQRAKAKKAVAPFRLVISAAVPYHDNCQKYASQRLKGDKP